MNECRRFLVILTGFVPIVGGCGQILGIDSHSLDPEAGHAGMGDAAGMADGSGASDGGTAADSGGSEAAAQSDTGYESDGEPQGSSGCAGDGAASEAGDIEAGVAMSCGFTMPNPAGAGLPNPASYTVNLDGTGTVTDNVTGLTWEGAVNLASQYTQTQAVDHCQQLGSGFRLPTRIELVSLVDFTRTGMPFVGIDSGHPTIDPTFNPTPAQRFWTSSHFTCNPNVAYYVGFDYGSTHPLTINSNELYFARCVRGTPSRCSPTHYQVEVDGVHDLVTGLTWQRAVAAQRAWSDAMAFCSALGMGWRLPSLSELQTIVDETKQSPPIDGVAFPQTPAGLFWTSSPQAGQPNYAWYVAFLHGHADTDVTSNAFWVRCVH
jgi:hypothetical protein